MAAWQQVNAPVGQHDLRPRHFAAFLSVRPVQKTSGLPWSRNKRTFSDYDVKKLRTILPKYGFQCDVKKDIKTRHELETCLKEYSEKNYAGYTLVLVFVTGYGVKDSCIWCPDGKVSHVRDKINSLFAGRDLPYTRDEASKRLLTAMVRAEKVFFVQGCDFITYPMLQPTTTDGKTGEGEEDDGMSDDGGEPTDVPTDSNISIFWSSIPGQVAWREKLNMGSMSVDHFAEELSRLSPGDTMKDIFTRVRDGMSRELESQPLTAPITELPTWTTTAIRHSPIRKQ